ncbi:MAG TPA: zeta toxin family protein [Chitinophagales bacterium]|nr:zeta toxin family protein [Chitinophagales bacterium]
MPRFRLFAGPNGSGKSSLFQHLRNKGIIHTELYVSADRIEAALKKDFDFNFNAYRVKVSEEEFKQHIFNSGLFKKLGRQDLNFISLQSGVLRVISTEINSYVASFVASYLVERLFESKQSFCFETVMSHQSKIEMLKLAKLKGYKTYLYFVFTENSTLNELRVKLRVAQGGHNVDPQKIRDRFIRSFTLLKSALQQSSEAFLINNSVNFAVVAEQQAGKLKWLVKQKPDVITRYAKL